MTRTEAIEAAARALLESVMEADCLPVENGSTPHALRAALALPPDQPPTCQTCEREAAPDPPASGELCPCCGREA